MNINLYAVWDRKSTLYRYQFFARSGGMAVRSFQVGINDRQTEMSKYPEDFALYEIGVFDDETGGFKTKECPVFIINGIDLKVKEESNE